MADCPVCKRIESGDGLSFVSDLVVAFADAFPVTPGHTLVLPRRHESDFFSLSTAEQDAVWQGVTAVRDLLISERQPDGFNVGLNAGRAAGQTMEHVHIHVIPRFTGDVEDPRGGIRWLIPAKARYWGDQK